MGLPNLTRGLQAFPSFPLLNRFYFRGGYYYARRDEVFYDRDYTQAVPPAETQIMNHFLRWHHRRATQIGRLYRQLLEPAYNIHVWTHFVRFPRDSYFHYLSKYGGHLRLRARGVSTNLQIDKQGNYTYITEIHGEKNRYDAAYCLPEREYLYHQRLKKLTRVCQAPNSTPAS